MAMVITTKRKDATPQKPLLHRLYESGENSDLTLRTPTKDFKVHRCVVCTQSLLIKEICRTERKDKELRPIQCSVSAEVMDVLIRRMYDVEVRFVPKETEPQTTWRRKATPETFFLALSVREVADRYLITNLDVDLDVAVCNCITHCEPSDVVDFAQALQRKGELGNWFGMAVIKLAKSLREVLNDPQTWAKLCADPGLQRWVLDCVAEMMEHMAKGDEPDVLEAENFFANKTGKTAQAFASPDTRPAWIMTGSYRHWFL